jgi:Asp-tRNA(Asn)/Glu-tRNA(Gln) amidotransferase A subunit family amidase
MSRAGARSDSDSFAALGPERLLDAQRAVGLEFTEAERTQMLKELDGQLALLAHRREFSPERSLEPAHVFQPALHGHEPPSKAVFDPGSLPLTAPGSKADVAYASLAQLSDWLERKEISSRELTDLYLERLEAHADALECVVTMTPELARKQADAADDEMARGPRRSHLHGIPWGAKDLLDTKGIPTTWGATPYEHRVAKVDAALVERLEAAGAVLVAKLSLGALAYGDRWFGGLTRNPWNREEGSSGSSAGSAAAVVAGLVGFAIGSETLGSIVAPSMRCGASGLRPSFGRVSRYGAMPLAWSLDKLGPLCRYAQDTAFVFNSINGVDHRDASSRAVPFVYEKRGTRGRRVAYDPAWFVDTAPELSAALSALGESGVELVERKWPELAWDALLLGLFAESAAALEEVTFKGLDDQLVWQEDMAWPNTLRSAWFVPGADVIQADRLRRRAMQVARDAFTGVDAWVSPGQDDPMLVATNYVGYPSLTLPAAMASRRKRDLLDVESDKGEAREVPLALTFWGGLDDEGTLVEIGEHAESVWGLARRRPPGF